jgi:hypothetical protein
VLTATVAATGAPRIVLAGKAARSLKAGRYDLALVDSTAHAGLTVRRPNGSVLSLTGGRFVGKRTTRLALKPGTWRFSSGGRSLRVVVT